MRIRSVALCAALLGCCAAVPLSDWHDGIAVRPASTLSQDMLGTCHVTRLRLRLLRGGALTPSRAAQTNYGGAQDGMSPYTPSFGTLEVLPPPGMDGALFGLPQPCRRTFQAAKVAWMRQGLTSGVRQGACGYGKLDKSQYPYWSVAALSLTNSFSVAGPAHACGMCFEIKCVDVGGAYGVRPSSFFLSSPMLAACTIIHRTGYQLEHGCLHLEGRVRVLEHLQGDRAERRCAARRAAAARTPTSAA